MRRANGRPAAESSRATRYAIVAFIALAIFAGGAAAAGACAQDVIGDWADNGTVDGTYPPDCYESAIAELPEDLRSYSSAAEDISRALQHALFRAAPSAEGSGGGASSGGEGDPGQDEAPSEESNGGEGEDEAAASPAGQPPSESRAEPGEPDAAVASAAAAELGDGGAGLPLPILLVLVLGGVAVAWAVAALALRGLRERRAGRG